MKEQQEQAGTSSSITSYPIRLTPPRRDAYSQLLPDDLHSQPGLSALDELNPNDKKVKARSTAFASNNTYEIWKETHKAILSSFNHRQLEQMRKDAQVPSHIFKSYRVSRGVRIPKPILVKALMIHRFNMKDPEKEAELEATKARNTQRTQSVVLPITQIALLLLVLRGQSEMQRLVQLHRVKLTPSKKKGEENPSLRIQGAKPSIDVVRDYVVNFCEVRMNPNQVLLSD